MRLDYGLYAVAIICFIIAGVFMVYQIPGFTLAELSRTTVTVILLALGIISAVVGYSVRPKVIMPITKPTTPPPETPTPPPQTLAPVEEVTPKPLPPTPTQPTEAAVTPTGPEQPVTVAEEEKPKPVRRRRKKAQ